MTNARHYDIPFDVHPDQNPLTRRDEGSLDIHTIYWTSLSPASGHQDRLATASALIDHDTTSPCPLRLVFLPYACRNRADWEALRMLKNHYMVPDELDVEQWQSVTHSFGSASASPGAANVDLTWFHFLSRSIPRNDHDHDRDEDGNIVPERWKVSQYVLHVRRPTSGSGSSSAGQQLATTLGEPFVTLLCFGAPSEVENRCRKLLDDQDLRRYVEQPLQLFRLVWDGLYELVDNTAWAVTDLFAPVESSTLELATAQKSGTTQRESPQLPVDFAALHNTSKDCIYMLESVNAALMVLEALIGHISALNAPASAAQPAVNASTTTAATLARAFEYRQRTFQSTLLRLQSLEKRITNISSLSFNMVTQQDSQVMRADSRAMKIIAALTMVFLPATGVASVLSSPFFQVDFETERQVLEVARSFRWFWAIAVPLTLAVLFLWLLWYFARVYERLQGSLSRLSLRRKAGRDRSAVEIT